MKTLVTTAFIMLLTIATAHAGLKVVGRGDAMRLDPSAFPADMKASYEIMRVRCIKCHTMERTIIALTSGIAPISGQPFDRNATRAYGIKMMRKPDSNMNKQEVKTVVDLLNYLLVEAGK
ncbi:MAG: cytochrome C [Geobacter sp.]|nr:cytochrome C [Geobacter sp.]